MICSTFTDSRVLCGTEYAKCFYTYGTSRLRVPCFQEVIFIGFYPNNLQNAIRIAYYTINTIANRHGKYIKPVLSYQSGFYFRLFFTVHSSRQQCQMSPLKYGNVK